MRIPSGFRSTAGSKSPRHTLHLRMVKMSSQDRIWFDSSGSSGIAYHVSIEGYGKALREDLRKEELLEALPSALSKPLARTYLASDLSQMETDVTSHEAFMREREMEANFLLKHRMEVLYQQLAIFAKLPDNTKHLMAITCLDARGLVWFDVIRFRLENGRKIEGKKLSEKRMRHMLGIKDARIHVYSQTFDNVIESYFSSIAGRSSRSSHGIASVRPHSRKPQKFIQAGRPIPDVEFSTRQKSNDRYRYMCDWKQVY